MTPCVMILCCAYQPSVARPKSEVLQLSATHEIHAPIIKLIEWGKMVVDLNNKKYVYRDCKVAPGKATEWNWKLTGTQHHPGVQITDFQEFIHDVDIVILSRGMDLILEVPQETIDYVKGLNKQCFVGQTQEMVVLYNKLVAEGKKVGGLFHSTC